MITIDEAPSATVTTTETLCNVAGGLYTNTLDLSTLVTAGQMDGTWTDQMNNTVTTIDATGMPEGDYTYTYTISPAAGSFCTDVSYDVVISVLACPVVTPCTLAVIATPTACTGNYLRP
ncbi:MAG: hypothetical protein H6554_04090 [Chitinophagales bacterium]|nr:hypothetical protein [Chitinophagales bacterium]